MTFRVVASLLVVAVVVAMAVAFAPGPGSGGGHRGSSTDDAFKSIKIQ